MAATVSSLPKIPKLNNDEINHLFQNLFDDPAAPASNISSNDDGEGPTEEEVVKCLEQLVTGHSPSKTQAAMTPDTSTDSAFDSLLTSASKPSSMSSSSFSCPAEPIFYQDESDDEVVLAPPPKRVRYKTRGGGGSSSRSYELLCDDGFVYDQGFNSDDEEDEEEDQVLPGGDQALPGVDQALQGVTRCGQDKVKDQGQDEQPWLFLEESYEEDDDAKK